MAYGVLGVGAIGAAIVTGGVALPKAVLPVVQGARKRAVLPLLASMIVLITDKGNGPRNRTGQRLKGVQSRCSG
jgi:hypothetical protein